MTNESESEEKELLMCGFCQGEGFVDYYECPDCFGRGFVYDPELALPRFTINIVTVPDADDAETAGDEPDAEDN